MSPIDHLEAIADRQSRGADDVRKIAGVAKPLYASLDDSQKRGEGEGASHVASRLKRA